MTGNPEVETDGRVGYNDLAQEAEYSLKESAVSPFPAEPTHWYQEWTGFWMGERFLHPQTSGAHPNTHLRGADAEQTVLPFRA